MRNFIKHNVAVTALIICALCLQLGTLSVSLTADNPEGATHVVDTSTGDVVLSLAPGEKGNLADALVMSNTNYEKINTCGIIDSTTPNSHVQQRNSIIYTVTYNTVFHDPSTHTQNSMSYRDCLTASDYPGWTRGRGS